ncbi:hypothetical protein FOL47_004055 [Perkinsus chesapeaki]|uniref:SAM-dependent MTase RsmB/NOP-type domain-containing protein n=1 Tax=Perkinsus chesapeaki TaxID=330153 RepID=A0A7J6M4X3_PERCH|nr:hypothetical protein FOL47_004055 [Perkinsus chesapeaki]
MDVFGYSTCALNPIEDEAVVGSVVASSEGALVLSRWKEEPKGLKYEKGATNWKVKSGGKWFTSFEEAQAELGDGKDARLVKSSMFPQASEGVDLSQCVRVYPHLQNTGGFFIAVIRKVRRVPWETMSDNLTDDEDTCEVEKKDTSEVDKKDTSEVDKKDTSEVEKKDTSEVEKKDTSEVEKKDTSEVEKKDTSEVEKKDTSEVEKKDTSEVEKKDTSEVEKRASYRSVCTGEPDRSPISSAPSREEKQSDFYECPEDFAAKLKSQFGIPESEVDGLLWSKSPEPTPRKLWLMSRSVDRFLRSYSRHGLKVVSAGTPAFDRPSGAHSEPRVLMTALQWLTISKRVYDITPKNFAKLLITKIPAEAVGLGEAKESAIVARCRVGDVTLRMPVYRGRHLAEGLVSEDTRPGLAWCISKEINEDIDFPGLTLSANSDIKLSDKAVEGEASAVKKENVSDTSNLESYDAVLAGLVTSSVVIAVAGTALFVYRTLRRD